jgi:thioredoxin-like negative regulator of GroEL
LETALALEPENQDFFVALAECYLKSGQPDRARSLAENTIRRFPDHRAAKELLKYFNR